jgi:hypothetical protein
MLPRMADDALAALAPTFAALSRAVRDADLPEPLRIQAFDVLMAMSGEVLTPAFPARYAAMSRLLEQHPELAPVVTPHLAGLAHLLH